MSFFINNLLVIALCFVTLCSCREDQKTQNHTTPHCEINTEEVLHPLAKLAVPETKFVSPVAPSENIPLSPQHQLLFRQAVNRWNALGAEFIGQELLAKQREVAFTVVTELAGSQELDQFLRFLASEGVLDLHKELIEKGLVGSMTGERADAMRQWLLTLQDREMKQQLMLQGGAVYDGNDFAEYFRQVGTTYDGHNCQCRLLTGYCSTMARTDPEAAIALYKELAYPLRIDNTGMSSIMSSLPANADFLKIVTQVAEDSKGLSKGTRTALLDNWSQVQPAEAAQYVMGNTSVVHADQMAVVMKQWVQKSPDQAALFLSGFDPSPHKDQGSLVLVERMKQQNPADAFAVARGISDFDLKVKTATEVFNQWSRVNRAAAETAWLEAFPPEQ